jgi:hypothetical protein
VMLLLLWFSAWTSSMRIIVESSVPEGHSGLLGKGRNASLYSLDCRGKVEYRVWLPLKKTE